MAILLRYYVGIAVSKSGGQDILETLAVACVGRDGVPSNEGTSLPVRWRWNTDRRGAKWPLLVFISRVSELRIPVEVDSAQSRRPHLFFRSHKHHRENDQGSQMLAIFGICIYRVLLEQGTRRAVASGSILVLYLTFGLPCPASK